VPDATRHGGAPAGAGREPPARDDEPRILLGHGSGGRLYRDLVRELFLRHFDNPVLARLDDAAALVASGRVALTTDAHVVQPLAFAGGDIGRLAVAGTVNDLATAAARPLGLAAAFVIEEGFELARLDQVCASMAATAAEAPVAIVTGDTKVVERGAADGLFITTTGLGEIVVDHDVSAAAVAPGDALLLSGTLGDHALAVLVARGDFNLSLDVRSDCAPLWRLVEAALAAGGAAVHFMRDPTRGGLATVLAELAEGAGLGIEVDEEALPVSAAVRSACELLGYDPLALANEGKMLFAVAPGAAGAVLEALRGRPEGARAAHIGTVVAGHRGRVALRTAFGTRRVVDMPVGELLPRIC
jgi:hydrogenase expression/formation protein HypE